MRRTNFYKVNAIIGSRYFKNYIFKKYNKVSQHVCENGLRVKFEKCEFIDEWNLVRVQWFKEWRKIKVYSFN